MKQFSCGDVVPGCTAKFTASTQDELLESVAEHAATEHGITQVTPELASLVVSNIQEVPTV